MFKIQTLNAIARRGLQEFPSAFYELGNEIPQPDAILLRSYKLHDVIIPPSVKAVGRAGAGVNNIPIAQLTKRGIPVFNTPGANANAVCELVLAGMLLASRNICHAWHYIHELQISEDQLSNEIEKNKKRFLGFELAGKTLGIVGLGSVGVKVANAAVRLGMQVIGYDPTITVNRAWELSSQVKQAHSIENLLLSADLVSLHIPLTNDTRALINYPRLKMMKNGAVLLNFAREEIVDRASLVSALNEEKLHCYVTDFPHVALKEHKRVINLPHIGASTQEAEENCAVMIARQIRIFLENGSITNAVNFPSVDIPSSECTTRLIVVNENIPNMVAQISAKLASLGLNINSLTNKSKEDIAYTVIELEKYLQDAVLKEISEISGVLQCRLIRSLEKNKQVGS